MLGKGDSFWIISSWWPLAKKRQEQCHQPSKWPFVPSLGCYETNYHREAGSKSWISAVLEGQLGRVSWQEELGCGEKRSYLTSFLLSFKDSLWKPIKTPILSCMKSLHMLEEGCFLWKQLYQKFQNALIQDCNKTHCYTFSCETDSCVFRVWLCCSQDFCSCFKLPTALSKKLTLATWNKITRLRLNHLGFSLTQFDFRSYDRWSYSYARKLEENKKKKANQVSLNLCRTGSLFMARLLCCSSLELEYRVQEHCPPCPAATFPSMPLLHSAWNLLRNQTALKLCSKSTH